MEKETISSIEWDTPEYLHSKKTSDWYWTVGVTAITLSVIAFLFDNPIFALLIIIAAFSLMLYATKEPKELRVQINETGVTINKHHYPHSVLEAFWIDENGVIPKLLLKSNRTIVPLIVIPLPGVSLEEIEEVLKQHLTKKELHEPLLQYIMEYLGF